MPPIERCSAVKDKLRPTKSTETSTPADEGKVVNESWRWRGTTTRHGIATDGRYDRIRTMLRPVDPTSSTRTSRCAPLPLTSPLPSDDPHDSATWPDLRAPTAEHPPPETIDPPCLGAASIVAGDSLVAFRGYAEVGAERFAVDNFWRFASFRGGVSACLRGGGRRQRRQLGAAARRRRAGGDVAVLLGGVRSPDTGHGRSHPGRRCRAGLLVLGVVAAHRRRGRCRRRRDAPRRSRQVALSLSLLRPAGDNGVRHVVCLHNHRCSDHVWLLSVDDDAVADGGRPALRRAPDDARRRRRVRGALRRRRP